MDNNANIYSAMQTGEPLKRYQKTILAKVHLLILDPFSDKPAEIILEGSPGSENSYVEVWSEKADLFLNRMNRKHFQDGRLAVMEKPVQDTVSINQLTDDEVEEILSSRFMVLKNRLDKFTSTAPVYRLLNRARERDMSEKIIRHIEEKLAEFDLE